MDSTGTGQTEYMRTTDLDIGRLSVAERIQLAEDLWDSVAAEAGALPLTATQTVELERRLADLARDPGAGETWNVVRARVEQRSSSGCTRLDDCSPGRLLGRRVR